MAVSPRLVIIKAAALCREFRDSANCLVCHHPLVYSMSWFGSSYGHENLPVASKRIGGHSNTFMETVHPMVVGIIRDQDFIINLDQLPIPFTFDRQKENFGIGRCSYS